MKRILLVSMLLLVSCGDPCKPKEGCLRSHKETRTRNTDKCLRSHMEQRYHRGLVWHALKPHWRWELKPDRDLTKVCDEYETEQYEVDVCDERGILRDADGNPIPEDAEACARSKKK